MYSENKFKQIEEKTNAMHPYLFFRLIPHFIIGQNT